MENIQDSQNQNKFLEVWVKGSIQDKVQELQNVKNSCINLKEDNQKKMLEMIEPYYLELIRHSNPKIYNLGIEILQIHLNSENKLQQNVSNIVCAIIMAILLRKDCKDKGLQLLLGISEQNFEQFKLGLNETLQFNEPKSIVELLKFLSLLIIKNDEQKKKFFIEFKEKLFDLAVNFSAQIVRQTSLDFILKLAEEYSADFIKDRLGLLKETQRIYLAKKLKDQGIANDEILAIEALKSEQLKAYKQSKPQEIKKIYQNTFKEQTDREIFMQELIGLPKKERDEKLKNYDISNVSKLHLFVDAIKYAKGKVKVHVIKDIHNTFMNKPQLLDEEQLKQRWNFEKYFTFDNPLIKKLLMDMVIVYIKKMQQTQELQDFLHNTLKLQMQNIFTQCIKSVLSSEALKERTIQFTKQLIEYKHFNNEIMISIYDALLNKFDTIQISAVYIVQSALISDQMFQIPKMECILNQISTLTSSQTKYLREQCIQTLLQSAKFIGVDIYNYTTQLNKFQKVYFEKQIKLILGDHKVKEEKENENENEEEKKSNICDTVEAKINQLKFLLCFKNIQDEENLVQMIRNDISKQQNDEKKLDYVQIFKCLIERFGENIINNTAIIIGRTAEYLSKEDQIKLFLMVFNNQHAIISNIAKRTLFQLQNIIGFKNLKQNILDLFFVSHQEEKVCTFIEVFIDKLDDQTIQQITQSLFQIIQDSKEPKSKVVFINFLAKVWIKYGEEFITDLAEEQIQDEKQRKSLIQKIDTSQRKYKFIEGAKKNQSDEQVVEKASFQNQIPKNEVEEEQEQLFKEKKQKQAISFKEFRKQQLQKINDQYDQDNQQEEGGIKPVVQKIDKVQQNQDDDEI